MNIRQALFATLAAAAVSAAALSATEPQNPRAGAATNTVVYRGCLNKGSADRTFVLTKATEKGQKGAEKVTFKVVAATDKVSLERFVLNEVEVTGTMDGTPAPAGSAESGETLATLTATKVTWRADYCG